jgi:excisionase family DNA binding protein
MGNLLTTSEAAEKMNVSASRIRQLIIEKRIDSKKVGRDHLIEEDAIIQFKCDGLKKRGRPNKSLRKR